MGPVANSDLTDRWHIPHRALRFLARLGVLGLLAGTVALTAVSTYVSVHNYPGGQVHTELEALGIPKNCELLRLSVSPLSPPYLAPIADLTLTIVSRDGATQSHLVD